jgi:hypothetical protein
MTNNVRGIALLCILASICAATASGQSAPYVEPLTPTYDNLVACGSIWVYPVAGQATHVRVARETRCGPFELTATGPARDETAPTRPWDGRIVLDVAVRSVGREVRLPVHLFIDPDSIELFGPTIATPHGPGTRVWLASANGDGGDSRLGGGIDLTRHRRWSLFRNPQDTVEGGVLRSDSSTEPRTVRLSLPYPSVEIDSVRLPFRIEGHQPAPPILTSPPLLDPAIHLRGVPLVHNLHLFPRPFYDGIVVLQFASWVDHLDRQLVLDRLGGTVIAYRPATGPEPDLIVRVGAAWRDSLQQVSILRKLEGATVRFGYLLRESDTATVTPRIPVDNRVIDDHNPSTLNCNDAADHEVHRRLAMVSLSGASAAERDAAAALVAGRWVKDPEFPRHDRLEMTGTRSQVDTQLVFLLRLPQVSAADLNWWIAPGCMP